MTNNRRLSADPKIRSEHQGRLAVVYVRQSTVHQVQHHQESTQLQYSLVEQACRLGWPKEQVLVIDEDLGLSGATAEGRVGFQRLLSEVALNHVGLILGVEMSRLARSCIKGRPPFLSATDSASRLSSPAYSLSATW